MKSKRKYGIMSDGYDETATSNILKGLAEDFWYYETLDEFYERIDLLNAFVNNIKERENTWYKYKI